MLLILMTGFSLSVPAEFRIWKDKNGNSLEAEFVRKSGRQIVIRDRDGKAHWIDPEKLSDEDRLYLNPPPEFSDQYELMVRRRVEVQKNYNARKGNDTQTRNCTCSLDVKPLTEDAATEGLKAAMMIVGKDANGDFLVLDKVEEPLEMVDGQGGRIEGKEFALETALDSDNEVVEGVTFHGWLAVLYSSDGKVLVQASPRHLLGDYQKALDLEIGDRFNGDLEKIDDSN